jgi:hypothetical protein
MQEKLQDDTKKVETGTDASVVKGHSGPTIAEDKELLEATQTQY